MTSFFTIDITTFQAIHLKISLTPIGLKPGFLFSGIKRHAVKASICPAHNILMNSATAFRKSDAQLPNKFETKPHGPEPPFVFIAAFITSASSMSSYTT